MANKMIAVTLDTKEYTLFISSNVEVLPVSGKEKGADGKSLQARDPETGLPVWKFDADLCASDGSADVVTIKNSAASPIELQRRTEYKVEGSLIAKPWAMKDAVTGALNSGIVYTLKGSLVPAVPAVPVIKSFPSKD